MLSRLLFLLDDFSVDIVLLSWSPPLQEGVTMLSRSVSAAGGLRSTKVGVAETRLISTVSAKDILRSVQKDCETISGFTGLPLLLW